MAPQSAKKTRGWGPRQYLIAGGVTLSLFIAFIAGFKGICYLRNCEDPTEDQVESETSSSFQLSKTGLNALDDENQVLDNGSQEFLAVPLVETVPEVHKQKDTPFVQSIIPVHETIQKQQKSGSGEVPKNQNRNVVVSEIIQNVPRNQSESSLVVQIHAQQQQVNSSVGGKQNQINSSVSVNTSSTSTSSIGTIPSLGSTNSYIGTSNPIETAKNQDPLKGFSQLNTTATSQDASKNSSQVVTASSSQDSSKSSFQVTTTSPQDASKTSSQVTITSSPQDALKLQNNSTSQESSTKTGAKIEAPITPANTESKNSSAKARKRDRQKFLELKNALKSGKTIVKSRMIQVTGIASTTTNIQSPPMTNGHSQSQTNSKEINLSNTQNANIVSTPNVVGHSIIAVTNNLQDEKADSNDSLDDYSFTNIPTEPKSTTLPDPPKPTIIKTTVSRVSQVSQMSGKMPFGLSNEGNSCFFNSVLQCFAAILPLMLKPIVSKPAVPNPTAPNESKLSKAMEFVGSFFSEQPSESQSQQPSVSLSHEALVSSSQEPSASLSQCFFAFLNEIRNGDSGKYISTHSIHQKFKHDATLGRLFEYKQEDSNELFMFMFNNVLKDVISTFEVPEYSFRNCPKGHKHMKATLETVENISVPESANPTTLGKLLEAYFEGETLSDYKCFECCLNGTVKALAKKTIFYFSPLPKIFIASLVRFLREDAYIRKIETPVIVPEYLTLPVKDFDGTVLKEVRYRLVSLTLHSGSLNGGHYTAMVRYGDDWYYANDSNVTKTTLDIIKNGNYGSATPYNLFYERLDIA